MNAYRTTLHALTISWLLLSLATGCNKTEDDTASKLLQRQRAQQASSLNDQNAFDQQLAKAERFLAANQPTDALRELRPLLVTHPDDADLVILYARCEVASGKPNAAIETISTLSVSDPTKHAQVCWYWASLLAEAGRTDEAIAKFEELIDEPGYQNRTRHTISRLLHSQGHRLEAAVYLRDLARSGDITEKELLQLISLSDAFIDDTQPKPDFSKGLTPAALVLAMQYRLESKLDKANELIERLNVQFPELNGVLALEGRILAETQQLAALPAWLDRVPRDLQSHPNYWFVFGTWLQSQGKFAEAVRCFGETVTRDGTDRHAYLSMARSLTALERHPEAAIAYGRHRLIDETNLIAAKLGGREGTWEELSRIADLLDQLRRPWEALAWREVAARTHTASAQELASLKSRRKELEQQRNDDDGQFFLTCGIDLKDWPLSDEAVKQIAADSRSKTSETQSQDKPAIRLINVANEIGLDFQYENGDDRTDESHLLHQMTGGGIGVIDFDLDGWPDVYLGQGGGDAFDANGSLPNQLFRNLSGQRFENATLPSSTGDQGYAQGVAVADLNQDGFPDMVVANIGDNVIYLNQGDGTFSRRLLQSNAEPGMWTTSIACGDLSGDHLPEIVEINYVDDPNALLHPCTPTSDLCSPSMYKPATDRVWQIQADGTIKLWHGCSDIERKPGYGFAGVIANFDLKEGNDLFVANDTVFNHYWLSASQSEGDRYSLFENGLLYGCAAGLLGQRNGCMGIAQGDFNHDGLLDLHITNFWNEPSDLYLNQPSGIFTNGSVSFGLHDPTLRTVGWGTQAVDFDHDGWLDLVIANGHALDHRKRGQPFEMLPQLFRGTPSGFETVDSKTIGDPYWSQAAMGRTVTTLDWNRDGRTDVLVNHLDTPLALLENRTRGGSAIHLELVGVTSERDATGAIVTISSGAWSRTAWAVGGDGFLCSNGSALEFAIKEELDTVTIRVAWPSGRVQAFLDAMPGTFYLLVEDSELEIAGW